MLDESMFEDIQEIAENSAYLKAVEDKDVSLEMLQKIPPYEECKEIEAKLKEEGKLEFEAIFHEPTGYYLVKCFLISDYAVDKAVFIRDCEAYRSMRFESARRRVAELIYQRFVAMGNLDERDSKWDKGASVFDTIRKTHEEDRKEEKKLHKSKSQRRRTASRREVSKSKSRSALSGAAAAPAPAAAYSRETSRTSNPSTTDIDPEGTEEKEPRKDRADSVFQMGSMNNPIGVYGPPVHRIKEKVLKGEAPKELFDEVFEIVMADLKLDVYPRFLKSEFYRKYVRTKWLEMQKVCVKDFVTFRILGRGGFGAVHACRKKDSGTIYAMKCINKKLVKVKSALKNVMEERNVLTILNSKFLTNLKYALQDENNLYLVMDLMLGGDLKFHLINAGRFSEKRARFYAAEVLLGLEHLHSKNVIYRDLKLENVLLDRVGHCRLSDLGLAVITDSINEKKVKGYAGTPGYTAPEMIKGKLYGASVDIFSFGVMLYRMLCGSKPFKGKVDRDLDKAVIEKTPQFPKEIFTKHAVSLLQGLLQKKPEYRLGCGPGGIQEIKDHPFFESIDWGLLEAGYIDPPFVPSKYDVNAASLKDIGDFDKAKYKHVKLDERFKAATKKFDYVSCQALQDEMVRVLEKSDEGVNFEKFAAQPKKELPPKNNAQPGCSCCSIT